MLAAASPSNTGLVHDFLRDQVGASELWAHTGQVVLVRLFRILLVVVLAVVISRLGAGVIRRAVHGLRLRVGSAAAAVRAEDRTRTVGSALSSAFRAFVWVIAMLTVLGELGIQLGPFVAGATVVGAALGFGAQSLVKDFLSGFLILVEDQYGVGDVVTVNDTTGTVESLNFRTTRLRAVDGVVWYIPNGEIRKVGNNSDEFNRAVVDAVLPWPVDVERAIEIIGAAAGAVADDPAFRDCVLAPPDVWGVDTMSANGVSIKVAVKVTPDRRAAMARALRARIVAALQEADMGFRTVAAEQGAPDSTSS